jgi:drug/metabolite transporter (DMT)-like permease
MANPMFVAVASHWLDGERLTKHLMVGIGLALIGAICIGYGDFALSVRALLGDVLALLSALALGGYMLMGRRLRAQANLLNYLALVYTSAAVILLISATIAGYDFFGYSGTTYIMLVLLAVVPQLIGHSSLNWALRLMPATFVTVAILGEPVGATLLAYLILAEVPTLAEMGGGLLILCAITVAFWQRPEQLTRGSPMR